LDFFKSEKKHNIRRLHPGRLTWNPRIHPWKGETSSKPSFSGSMLILGGVLSIIFQPKFACSKSESRIIYNSVFYRINLHASPYKKEGNLTQLGLWVVVSIFFDYHPNLSNLNNIFQMGGATTN